MDFSGNLTMIPQRVEYEVLILPIENNPKFDSFVTLFKKEARLVFGVRS